MADAFGQGLFCHYYFRIPSTRKAFTEWSKSIDRPPRWSGAGVSDVEKEVEGWVCSAWRRDGSGRSYC